MKAILQSAVAAALASGVSAAMAATLTLTVVDKQGRAVPDAVVFLESAEAARLVRPLSGAEMGQRNKAFEPSVLVVTKGTSVDFPNRDTVRHHVYSFSPAKKFELKLYTGTPAKPVLFDQPGVAVLGCNIHDQMVSWVVIVDTPYYATTEGGGTAQIRDVPAGSYRLRSWHSELPVGAPAQEQLVRVGNDPLSVAVVLLK